MTIRSPSGNNLQRAAELLRQGGLVAYPTETYYGIAADPFNEGALRRLHRLKKRPREKPISVLIGDMDTLSLLVEEIPAPFHVLMEKFWPGPLTLVFPARSTISCLVTAGTGTIGIRLSPHPVALDLIKAFDGKPVTATSANISGCRPARTAAQAASQFGKGVDMILDGGTTVGESASTLVGIRRGRFHLIREGALPFGEIIAVAGETTQIKRRVL